ncbi:MAG: solute:sodium symporter family transporter [Planctomycetes bacterium]|nr:solute:sodium symporter family transporter [Planctomycetota bacterium]
MELSAIDMYWFVGFIAMVIGVSLWASRKEETTEDYFLAGRNLSWWLIGFSLIASNISTEHFVGMTGDGSGEMGMAVASYEWMASVTLVVVGLFFLPKFLGSGIFTIPEYLEYRYNHWARSIMAFYLMVVYALVSITVVLYSGGLALMTIFGNVELFGSFQLDLTSSIWLIGILAAVYTVYGGFKAVVWSDLIQGGALLIGGVFVMFLAFNAVGGWSQFYEANSDRMHMFLPADHPKLPWTALILGLWIPHFYYWGLNQFITQRTLAARDLRQGQRGIMFAATLKLIIPFIIIFPGMVAGQLYPDQLADNQDQAYPMLLKHLLPVGFRGVMFAALFGAIMSSLDSLLNSASTIFTIDLYKRLLRPKADPKRLILIGRLMTVVFVVIGCTVAPLLVKAGGIFQFMQEFQGYISPAILGTFVFGFVVRRAPAAAGVAGLLTGPIVYGALQLMDAREMVSIAFLNRMAITLGVVLLVMSAITLWRPLAEPKVIPIRTDIDMTAGIGVKIWGGAIIAVVAMLYIVFR